MSNKDSPKLDNDTLVEIVKRHPDYQEFHSPEYLRVLEAMRGVDRKKFLPDVLLGLTVVDREGLGMMHQIIRDLQTIDQRSQTAGKLILPGAEPRQEEYAQAQHLLIGGLIGSAIKVVSSGQIIYVTVRDAAYSDSILPIGHGQTCSQPSLVAFMGYFLGLEEGMKVLEIGSGCGYSAAITSELIGPSGHLVTMEIIPELAELARRNLENHFGKEGLERRLEVIPDDGSVGSVKYAPFDRIYLTAGIKSSFDPSILAKQLNPNGGVLLFPEERGDLIRQRYEGGKPIGQPEKWGNVGFVPLQGKNT